MLIPRAQYAYVTFHRNATANGYGVVAVVSSPENGSYTTLTLQVSGTFSANVTLQGSVDGEVYTPIAASNLETGVETPLLTPGLYRVLVAGLTFVRVQISGYASGAVTVVGNVTS